MKTRLIPTLGAEGAARLARAFFEDTMASALACGWARVVIAGDGNPAAFAPLPPEVAVWQQGSGDLGERMERVLARALEDAPAAIVIGTDSPGLPREILDHARQLLGENDAVIGPSEDGGFYLLGLRRCPAGLLAGLPWSCGVTCERTVQRLQANGLRLRLLSRWFDIDHVEDLRRFVTLLRQGRVQAPKSAAAIAQLEADGVWR